MLYDLYHDADTDSFICTLKDTSGQNSISSRPARVVRVGKTSTRSTMLRLSFLSEERQLHLLWLRNWWPFWRSKNVFDIYVYFGPTFFSVWNDAFWTFTPTPQKYCRRNNTLGLTLKTKFFILEDINEWERWFCLWMMTCGYTRNIENEGNMCCHLKIWIFSPFSMFS